MKQKLFFYLGALLIIFCMSCNMDKEEIRKAKSSIKEALNNINAAKNELGKARKAEPSQYSDKSYKTLLAYGNSFYKTIINLNPQLSNFDKEQLENLVLLMEDVNSGTRDIINFLNNKKTHKVPFDNTKGEHIIKQLALIKPFFDSYIANQFSIID
ncbi:MAG: hypothetical protein ACQPRJ_02800 [Solitalea-like symbiont of Acarus siro]